MKREWWIGIAACFCVAILSELPEAILLALNDAPLRPERLLATIARWTIWGAIFGPLVYRAAYRWGALRIALAALPVMFLYRALVERMPSANRGFFQPVIVFTLTAGYGLLAQNRERRTTAERTRLDAEQRFAIAQVELLRSELQPHFLFNALNTVSALATRDPEKAASIAEKLRDLFRASARAALPAVTTVAEELAFTQKYLDIQEARFNERLRTSFAIEEGVATASIPSLLLQPLVENAIRHGMARREGIALEVRVRRIADELQIAVVDDGVVDDRPVVEAIGLTNTRARLRALYGDRASLIAQRRSEGGFVAEICIPYDCAELE
jgi:hypothetical protein